MMEVSNPGGNVDNKVLSPILEAVLEAWYAGFPQGGNGGTRIQRRANPERHRSFGCWEAAERPVRLGANDGLIKPWGEC